MNNKISILCVDDEKSVLKALERLFLDTDYEIITAESGEEGLKALKEEEMIQIVISDYRMPGMNGVDFLKEVRKLRPDTIRIVLSGYADTAAIVEAINEGGIYKFIPKPWNDDELKDIIGNALDHYCSQQRKMQPKTERGITNDELPGKNINSEKSGRAKTSGMLEHDMMLARSQLILEALPVGVVGIDQEGLIVQCNRKVLTLLDKEDEDIIGMDRKDTLTEEVNMFIEAVAEKGVLAGHIENNGTDIRVKGVHMKQSDGNNGIVLTLEEVHTDE